MADVPTANGRIYSSKLWNNQLSESSKVMARVKSRSMTGEANHPGDGRDDIKNLAIIITSLVREGNQIKGRAELLEDDMPAAKAVRSLLKSNVQLGISSRGRGSVGGDGKVQDDYVLETFDIVKNPAVSTAIINPISEDVNTLQGGIMPKATLQSVQEKANGIFSIVEDSINFTASMKALVIGQAGTLATQLDEMVKQETTPSVSKEANALQNKLLDVKRKVEEGTLPEPRNVTPDPTTPPKTVDVPALLNARYDDKNKNEGDDDPKKPDAKKPDGDPKKPDGDPTKPDDPKKPDATVEGADDPKKPDDDPKKPDTKTTEPKTEDDLKKEIARLEQVIVDKDALIKDLEATAVKAEEDASVAIATIAEMQHEAEMERVKTVVRESIQEHPHLAKVKGLIEECTSEKAARKRVEELNEAFVPSKPKNTFSPSLPPKTGVLTESTPPNTEQNPTVPVSGIDATVDVLVAQRNK